jgi:hypothetical protein
MTRCKEDTEKWALGADRESSIGPVLPRSSWDPITEKPFLTNEVSNVCFLENTFLAMSGKRE